MGIRKHFTLLVCLGAALTECPGQSFKIANDSKEKTITLSNQKMSMTLDYNKKLDISLLKVNGQNVIRGSGGLYSMIRTKTTTYSTLHLLSVPIVKVSDNVIHIEGIRYGDKDLEITETWILTVNASDIKLDFERSLSRETVAEKMGLPVFTFSGMDTWEGAYQDYGGLAWFYLFNKRLDTYGVHSSSSDFWNSKTGNGLTVDVAAADKQIAMDYSRTKDDKMTCTIAVSQSEMQPRFDSGTNRRRFVRDTADVWAPARIGPGKSTQSVVLSYFDFNKKYGRGNLKGINQEQVSAVLNTIARIGVIDKKHFGGNSWHTPYGPICLHEQYIAQMGLGINDSKYSEGYRQCLDFYRDNAIKTDGRVWPRWAYSNEDAMPNEFTDKGFYEAQWGYLLDSNPDYVTNVAELYDQIGDLNWVRTHQLSCEKALDWIIKRDSNGNGLVEMMTDSYLQKRGSDWIDIIWAAYENAFINAKLYRALVLWTDIERQLGNSEKEKYYRAFAGKLKISFNKPTSAGGFWDNENKCYVHWRDKDGSIHGTNMVIPVNLMSVAYNICDDQARASTILDDIEARMQKENLFFWPICLTSYAPGEGNDWQFPFPNYENGDIFLSWGSVGVKAYASYKPELAVKYVRNVLAQYAKDGLAFQRYGRAKQDGLGDDILSGNSLAVVGLYQAIYGVNPFHNRFYLDPHITPELAGTELKYNYRNEQLTINLDNGRYGVSTAKFKVVGNKAFGFYADQNRLSYFNGNDAEASLTLTSDGRVTIDVKNWSNEKMEWEQIVVGPATLPVVCEVMQSSPNATYTISVNGKMVQKIQSDGKGKLRMTRPASGGTELIRIDRL